MIWNFQRQLSRRLLAWGQLSILLGFIAILSKGFWRGMGAQFIVWGGINMLIAAVGNNFTAKRYKGHNDPLNPQILHQESTHLSRLLWLNTGLDMLYVLGGYWLAHRHRGRASWRGHGWGVIVQGAFLFFFDLFHAQRVPENNI